MHVRVVVLSFACILACLGLPCVAAAQAPQLRLPELSHLQEHAVSFVNVTLGPQMLELASALPDGHDRDADRIRDLFQEIKSVTVHSFKFDSDVHPGTDFDDLHRQLEAPGWTRLVQVHDRDKSEDVDVYLAYDEHIVRQVLILAVNPREITLVHVTGALEPSRIAEVRRAFEHRDGAAWPSER